MTLTGLNTGRPFVSLRSRCDFQLRRFGNAFQCRADRRRRLALDSLCANRKRRLQCAGRNRHFAGKGNLASVLLSLTVTACFCGATKSVTVPVTVPSFFMLDWLSVTIYQRRKEVSVLLNRFVSGLDGNRHNRLLLRQLSPQSEMRTCFPVTVMVASGGSVTSSGFVLFALTLICFPSASLKTSVPKVVPPPTNHLAQYQTNYRDNWPI